MGSCLLACCIVGTNVRTQHGCVCLVEPQDADVGASASAASTVAASCQPEMSEDWGFHVCVVEWYYDFKGMECLSR